MGKRYSDYFSIREDYVAIMTKDAINRDPRTWLGYYPHEKFVDLLRELLALLDGGNRALWVTGAYGTGKSHASLVLHKLFMDDESRVLEWLDKYRNLIPSPVRKSLLKQRQERVMVVFDSGSVGVNATNQYLIRLEQGISVALEGNGYVNPPRGKLDNIIEHVDIQGQRFLTVRDQMQPKLAYLNKSIKSVKELISRLREPKISEGLLSDTLLVLNELDVHPRISAQELLNWVREVLRQNKVSRIVYIWDEFSDFVNRNRSELKTMEEVAEAAQEGYFYFVPVTHMKLEAYMAEGSESAKKARDRFLFKTLDMPENIALKLAASAFIVDKENECEWQKEREVLWNSVKYLVDDYIVPKCNDEVAPEDFLGILPLHPMAAFLLKYLATEIGSNQRSLFDFLKSSAGSRDFQDFIDEGGLDVWNRQFLTVDYLWRYFIERNDEGLSDKVLSIRAEYGRHEKNLQTSDKRVLKTVFLFSLLGHTMANMHDLLQPTVENIQRSFHGDGGMQGVEQLIRELADQHCFSIVGGRCEMFGVAVDNAELERKKKSLSGSFSQIVVEEITQPKLNDKIRPWNHGRRCDIRAAGIESPLLTPGNIKLRETFGPEGNKVLVQFILAKDHAESLRIDDKARDLVQKMREYRMLFITMPELTFCGQNKNQWNLYLEQLAGLDLAQDNATKSVHKQQLDMMNNDWVRQVIHSDGKIRVFWYEGDSVREEMLGWTQFQKRLADSIKRWFPGFIDDLSGYNINAFGAPGGAQTWAKAGMLFEKMDQKGGWTTVITSFKNNGISGEKEWFGDNPNHPLTTLRDHCKRFLDNTAGKGNMCSVRRLFIDLQRAPYGLLGVPYSAFVLGFVLKEWLTGKRQLLWTDNKISKPLDPDVLSQIIADTVKDNGENKINNERFICRLSSEEKAFVEKSGEMFGFSPIHDGTADIALQLIEERLERITDHVPLWMLPQYVETLNESDSDKIREIVDNLCEAIKISSKGDTEKRSGCIRTIGSILLKAEGLTQHFAKFIKPDVFDKAFRHYVDTLRPDLKEKAKSVSDKEPTYYATIRNTCAPTSGWLWNSQDVSAVLDEVSWQYDVITVMQRLTGVSGWFPFDQVLIQIRQAVLHDNKISLDCIRRKYPSFHKLTELLQIKIVGEKVHELVQVLAAEESDLQKVFFDPYHIEQIAMARDALGRVWPQEVARNDEQAIYAAFGHWAESNEADFKELAGREIQRLEDARLSHKLKETWKALTGSESPQEWSSRHGIPSAFLFADVQVGREVVKVVGMPSAMSQEVQQRILASLLAVTDVHSPETCAKLFLDRVLRKRYRKLKISITKLSNFLKKKLGNDANLWLENDKLEEAIEQYVRSDYNAHHKKQVLDTVKGMSGTKAKEKLVQLVEDSPDVGLALLEED